MPQILPQTSSQTQAGKLASSQNGAPNTLCCFPWKFPETQSAGDPLFSFLFAGKPCTSQRTPPLTIPPTYLPNDRSGCLGGCQTEESSLREESSINSRGQSMPRGGRSCAERQEKPRGQGIGRRRRRRRTRQRRATRQRKKEATRERTTRVGRPRGGMKVAARIGEGLRREIGKGRRPRVRLREGVEDVECRAL